jgi:hypothetical protein
MTDAQSCMGGWCSIRNKCPHYNSAYRQEPADRLCIPGSDGVGMAIPMQWHRAAGTWEQRALPAQFVAGEAA